MTSFFLDLHSKIEVKADVSTFLDMSCDAYRSREIGFSISSPLRHSWSLEEESCLKNT